MKFTKQLMTLSALAIATLVTACGGGSSGSAPATASRDDVVSAGIITEFGSVFVNDRRYDTSGVQIKSADDDSLIDVINDDTNLDLLKSYLGLGQVIVLRGSTADDGSNGIADTIYIDNQLIGPVDTVNNTNATFTVLGQTVTVTPDTIIDDSIIEALITPTELSDDVRFADIEQTAGQPLTLSQLLTGGMVVEVSGFSSLDGVEATRIEDVNNRDRSNGSSSSSASGEVEVKGFVRNLTTGQFTISSLTVTYADSALDAEDFSGRVLADGDFVEVKGTVVASNTLDAREIELEDSFPGGSSSSGASSSSSSGASSSSSSGASSSSSSGASSSSSSSSGASSSSSSGASSSSSSGASSSSSSSRIEVEGIITEVRTVDSTIVIHGLAIRVDNVAQFSVGQRVKIKGSLQGEVLTLSQVSDSAEDNVRIEDQALTVTGNTVTTRLGVTIDISARTRVDGVGAALDAVEARGFLLDGNIVWTRVEFDDDDTSECRLRGPVESVTGTTAFSIQGVNVDVSQVTSSSGSSSSSSSSSGFRDAADNAITREAFFDQLNVGDVVQAQSIDVGGCTNGALVADEVEFESSSNFSSSSSSSGASSSSSSGASSSSSSGASSSSSSSGASSSSSS
jgi:hypothetical protein